MILCFSPVGSVLRVRARKFPAVVNCTAINWFHEWPEDALVSVSARFLEETEGIEVRWCKPRSGLQSLAQASFYARMAKGAGQGCSMSKHSSKPTEIKTGYLDHLGARSFKGLSPGRMADVRESPSPGVQQRKCPAMPLMQLA